MHKKKYICSIIFLLLGYVLFSYNMGCGIETIQLLDQNEAISSNEGTSLEETLSPNETISSPEAGQETLPEEDLTIELNPPENTSCSPAQSNEAQWWVSSNKSSVFLVGTMGLTNALAQVELLIPPTWIKTPPDFWTNAKGEFGVLLALSSNGQKGLKQQTIFARISSFCRSIELSSDKGKYKGTTWSSLSLPTLQIGNTSTFRFRVGDTTTINTRVFSSHPSVASVEDIQETRSNKETTLDIKLKGNAKGNFTLSIFEPSASPFSISLGVVD